MVESSQVWRISESAWCSKFILWEEAFLTIYFADVALPLSEN